MVFDVWSYVAYINYYNSFLVFVSIGKIDISNNKDLVWPYILEHNIQYHTSPQHATPYTIQYSTVQCCAKYSTAQHGTAQHSTVLYYRGKQKQQKWYLLRGENTSLCILFSTLFSVFANVFMFEIVHTLYMNTICFFNQVFSCFRENLAK